MQHNATMTQMEGLGACFNHFEGTYCVRKLAQFIISAFWLTTGLIILTLFVYKYRVAKPFWLITILSLILLSLIINIIFCFLNTHYWLYAIETFLYNLQYVVLVSYICYAYVLKHSAIDKDDLMTKLNHNMNCPQQPKITTKIIFAIVVSLLIAVYSSIFITSVIWEIEYDQDQNMGNPDKNVRYCEETWYLILNVLCVVLSIVVVIVMLKSQSQEYQKIVDFSNEEEKRQAANLTSSDGESSFKINDKQERSYSHISAALLPGSPKVNNPFRNLWIWVGINVLSQIFNLIQSGLLIKAKPPLCYITSNHTQSNLVSLGFILLEFYMGYAATLWYVCWVKILKAKTNIDRTILFSREIDIEGNIELFIPSKQQTISFQKQPTQTSK